MNFLHKQWIINMKKSKSLSFFVVFSLLAFLGISTTYAMYSLQVGGYGSNIIGPGWVNIIPGEVTENSDNSARISNTIVYTNITSHSNDMRVGDLVVTIPENAQNVSFDLVWSVSPDTDNFDLIFRDSYRYTPVNINIPLEIVTDRSSLINEMPTEPELQEGGNALKAVLDLWISQTSPWFKEYSIVWNKYPSAVKISYNMPSDEGNWFIPMRARLTSRCIGQSTDGNFENASCQYLDNFRLNWGLANIKLESGEMVQYRKNFALPLSTEISSADFDREWLHLKSTTCSPNPDLWSWYKFPSDWLGSHTSNINFSRIFNFFVNSWVEYYGAAETEDFCDQVVNTININNNK